MPNSFRKPPQPPPVVCRCGGGRCNLRIAIISIFTASKHLLRWISSYDHRCRVAMLVTIIINIMWIGILAWARRLLLVCRWLLWRKSSALEEGIVGDFSTDSSREISFYTRSYCWAGREGWGCFRWCCVWQLNRKQDFQGEVMELLTKACVV